MNISIFLFVLIILIFLSFINSQITFESITKNVLFYLSCNRNLKDEGIYNIPIFSSSIDYQNDYKEYESNSCFFSSELNSFISSNISIFNNISDFFLSFYMKANFTNTTTEIPLITVISLSTFNDFDFITLFNKSIYFHYKIDKYAVLNIDDFSTEKWYYISIKLIGRKVSVYLNGESKLNIQLDNESELSFNSFDHIFIGGNPLKGVYYDGCMDEIRIMNLTDFIISDEQIYAYYYKGFCDEGYYYNVSLKSCEPCCDSHCINCDVGSYCLVCRDNFYLNDNMNTCICQKENCEKCDDEGICIECNKGFSLDKKLNCVLNDCNEFPFCTSCSLEECITCMNNYELNKNGECILPSKTITSLIVCYIICVIIVWIIVFVLAKPKFFKTINK